MIQLNTQIGLRSFTSRVSSVLSNKPTLTSKLKGDESFGFSHLPVPAQTGIHSHSFWRNQALQSLDGRDFSFLKGSKEDSVRLYIGEKVRTLFDRFLGRIQGSKIEEFQIDEEEISHELTKRCNQLFLVMNKKSSLENFAEVVSDFHKKGQLWDVLLFFQTESEEEFKGALRQLIIIEKQWGDFFTKEQQVPLSLKRDRLRSWAMEEDLWRIAEYPAQYYFDTLSEKDIHTVYVFYLFNRFFFHHKSFIRACLKTTPEFDLNTTSTRLLFEGAYDCDMISSFVAHLYTKIDCHQMHDLKVLNLLDHVTIAIETDAGREIIFNNGTQILPEGVFKQRNRFSGFTRKEEGLLDAYQVLAYNLGDYGFDFYKNYKETRDEKYLEISEKFYQLALQLDSEDPSLHLHLGMRHLMYNDFLQAKFHFEKAYAIDQKNWMINSCFGKLYRKSGDFEKAKEYYEIAYKNGAPRGMIYILYADVLLELGEYEKAEKIAHQGKKAYPYAFSYVVLSKTYLFQKKYHMAKKFLKVLLDRREDHEWKEWAARELEKVNNLIAQSPNKNLIQN